MHDGFQIPPRELRSHRGILLSEPEEVDVSRATQIGELSVDRESIRRVLGENPYSLSVILDALLSALQRDTDPVESRMDLEGVLRSVLQEV